MRVRKRILEPFGGPYTDMAFGCVGGSHAAMSTKEEDPIQTFKYPTSIKNVSNISSNFIPGVHSARRSKQ